MGLVPKNGNPGKFRLILWTSVTLMGILSTHSQRTSNHPIQVIWLCSPTVRKARHWPLSSKGWFQFCITPGTYVTPVTWTFGNDHRQLVLYWFLPSFWLCLFLYNIQTNCIISGLVHAATHQRWPLSLPGELVVLSPTQALCWTNSHSPVPN